MAKVHPKGGAAPLRTNRAGSLYVGVLDITLGSGTAATASPTAGISSVVYASGSDTITIVFEASYAPVSVLSVVGLRTDGTDVNPVKMNSYTASTYTLVLGVDAAVTLADGDTVNLIYLADVSSIDL